MATEYSNAGDFNKGFIERLDSKSMFKILIENFNYYFFSHMQNVKLTNMEPQEVLTHFFDFFQYCGSQGTESDVSRSYAAYYVKKIDPARAFEEDEQHAAVRLVDSVLFLLLCL